ncbi:MAG: TlpA family protein disulfide reductase [Acidobacteria bacterium]|nr:TlpA family protein disulfide reductase [Acidobacteriota bacterium]
MNLSDLRPLALACIVSAISAVSAAQQPTPLPTSPPVTPPASSSAAPPASAPDDVRMIRLKISAGDLPSSESILEYHRSEKGEDGDYLLGLAWVARGAALMGEWTTASRYAKSAREIADAALKTPADYDTHREAVYALGTAIEVQAQTLAASGKKADAVRFLEESSRARESAPFNLRARIWKRRNLIELEGKPAPAIRAEDRVGSEAPDLASLRGKPVVLFFWWEACGDCRMQAAAFRRTVEKYAPKGVAFVAPTRFYAAGDHSEEKQKIEKSWAEVYKLNGSVPVPVSDEAMLRYGASATPTFVFVNGKGVVVRYSPTRMTEERLSAAIDDLLK